MTLVTLVTLISSLDMTRNSFSYLPRYVDAWRMLMHDVCWMSDVWMSCVMYEWASTYVDASTCCWCINMLHIYQHMWMHHAIWVQPISMSHVSYGWVRSRMNESCHVWMRRVMYEWAMSHVDESRHVWVSRNVTDVNSHVEYVVRSYVMRLTHIGLTHILWCINTCYRSGESCRICWCIITCEWGLYEWVTSHVNESCHVWMSHVTFEWVMSRINESCHIWIVMSHMNSHVNYVDASPNMSEAYVVASRHIWMSHVTYEWDMSPMNSHIDYVDASPNMSEAYMSESRHIYVNHITHMNESCHIWISHITYE